MAGTAYKRSRSMMIHMLIMSPEVHSKYISWHPSPPDEVSYNNKQNNNTAGQRNITYESTTKVPLLLDQHCSTKSKLHIQPFRRLANPATPSYIRATPSYSWECGGLIVWGNWNRNSWVGGSLYHSLFISVWFNFYVALRGQSYMGSFRF